MIFVESVSERSSCPIELEIILELPKVPHRFLCPTQLHLEDPRRTEEDLAPALPFETVLVAGTRYRCRVCFKKTVKVFIFRFWQKLSFFFLSRHVRTNYDAEF